MDVTANQYESAGNDSSQRCYYVWREHKYESMGNNPLVTVVDYEGAASMSVEQASFPQTSQHRKKARRALGSERLSGCQDSPGLEI